MFSSELGTKDTEDMSEKTKGSSLGLVLLYKKKIKMRRHPSTMGKSMSIEFQNLLPEKQTDYMHLKA